MVNRSSSKQTDPSLLATAWGSLWGVALGTWLLIPDVVTAHHIRPDGRIDWALLILALVVIFAMTGAFLGFVGGFLLTLVQHLTALTFHDRIWGYGLFTGVLIVAAYGCENYLIHVATFWTFDGLSLYFTQAKAIVLLALVMSACLTAIYAFITRHAQHLNPLVLAVLLAAIGATGALAAPARCGVENLSTPEIGPLLRGAGPTDVPLLFIGLDGATWRVLGPAMDHGGAPTFRSLLNRGTSGDVEALWPPYWSSSAWASIVTGLPREATGVYEDLAALAPGLPPFQVPLQTSFTLNPMYTARSFLQLAGIIEYVPPPRALLRGKPVWQLLHEAGVNSAVIRFRFTYPPNGEADVMVSDWVGEDAWEAVGVKHRTSPDAVAPARLADELLAPFRADRSEQDTNLFERLVPGPDRDKPADAVVDPFAYLRASADIDERTFQVSMAVLGHNPRQPFLAIYLDGLDSAEHAFWQYRFPEDFATDKPSDEDVKRFGPVIDRYVQFVDERLKALLALYDEEPNVVIVSDHGHGASTIVGGWRGWHTRTGLFIAAGPSVPTTKDRINVSYYDIVPTLASLKGFDKPSGLKGVALFPEHQPRGAAPNSQ